MKWEGAKTLSLSYPVPGRVLGSFFNCLVNPHSSCTRRSERLRIYPGSQSFTDGRSWSHTTDHLTPIIGSFLGTMLRPDESFLCDGRLLGLLDSQGSGGLGSSTVTEFCCCSRARCHIPDRSKPNMSSVIPISELLLCLKFPPISHWILVPC